MQLQRDVFPDFYIERENIIEENMPDLFTGRRRWLEGFWNNLAIHARGSHP